MECASADTGCVTTVLVNNIHCASCVLYIQDVLTSLGPAVQRVETSILSHEVRIYHTKSLSTSNICLALSGAAFEIHSATTVDGSGMKLQEFDLSTDSDGWLEAAASRWRPHAQLSPISRLSCIEPARTSQRKRHLENCAACREEQSSREKATGAVPSKGSMTKVPEDVELGDWQPRRNDQITKVQRQSGSFHSGSPLSGGGKELPGREVAQSIDRRGSQDHSLTLSIGGMTCASCATSISQALNQLGFVRNVSVNLMTNSASLDYIGDKALCKEIVTAINDIGFDASIADNNLTLSSSALASKKSQSIPTDETRFEAVLSIGGMTCASCTGSVGESLRSLSFVDSVEVTLLTNSAVVIFSGQKNLHNIIGAIEDIGYECTVERCNPIEPKTEGVETLDRPQPRSVQLKIDGMFCKHCPANIVNGVKSRYPELVHIDIDPSLKDPVLKITYMPAPPNFTIRDIVCTIDLLNESFRTHIYHPPSIEQRSQAMHVREQRRLLRRLLLSFIFAIPTLLIGVVWMSLVPKSNSIRVYFEHPVMSGRVTRAEWALLFLATPVMFLAADVFHIRAIKEIRALWRRSSRVPILRRFYRFGSMNLLISAGTSVAYFSSLALLIIAARSSAQSASHSATYFDAVVFLTFFILIGRYLEAYSKSKAGNAVALLVKLRPRETMLVTDTVPDADSSERNESTEKEASNYSSGRVDTDLLEIGDVVFLPNGSCPPADGIIVTGSTNFDESSLTGESKPVPKSHGDKVFAGAVNIGDPITVKVTEIGGTSMLDRIISVIREGQTKRAPVERVVDSLTAYFVPIITALAILTFFIWFALGQSGYLPDRYLDSQSGGWAFWSLEFAIAVFVVACPCGIGLAAPTALFVGGGLAAKNGILVRGGGEAFQEASNIDIVVFDKTGTLTEGGNLRVTEHEMTVEGRDAEVTWSITKSLEENSGHPIASAVLDFASSHTSLSLQLSSIKEIPGRGLCGTFIHSDTNSDEREYFEAALGSESLIESLEQAPDAHNYFITNTLSLWKSQSKSVALLAIRRLPNPSSSPPASVSSMENSSRLSHDWKITALFAISDLIRPSALPTIQALHARNIPVYMLTGDNPTTAAAVASSLSIPLTNVFAGVLPTEKAAKIQALQQEGPRRRTRTAANSVLPLFHKFAKSPAGGATPAVAQKPASVVFIGDGINDAPALSVASVSICVASASDIALTSSSFVLLSPSLEKIIELLDLSKQVFRRVRFNFAWAVAYNLLLVPVAAGVFFKAGRGDMGWRLGPVWGSAAMALSSCSVVLSSLALRWREIGWGLVVGRRKIEIDR